VIGSGLKKLAAQYNMKVAQGVAYGMLNGYATTMSEGGGYKVIYITTHFEDSTKRYALMEYLDQRNLLKEYSVRNISVEQNVIQVVFNDTMGTMKKLQSFIEWFYPLLPEYSAADANVCSQCGMEIGTEGVWELMNGAAYHMHESCAGRVQSDITMKNEQRRVESTGSYGSGLLGALLGALIGAIVWGIVLNFGFVAGIVGFVIGWLAEKGYNLLKGRQGKGKIAILIVAVIFGVIVGTFIGDAITLIKMLNSGEIAGSYSQIPGFILYLFSADSEYRIATLGNMAMGLLFAGLGVFTLIRNAGKAVADEKVTQLPRL
jgi:hypothetical protein